MNKLFLRQNNTRFCLELLLIVYVCLAAYGYVFIKQVEAQSFVPAKVDSLNYSLDAPQNSLSISAQGTRSCDGGCSRLESYDAQACGWLDGPLPGSSQFIGPTDPRLGCTYYPYTGPFIWFYNRTVDTTGWPNGNYMVCVEVDGSVSGIGPGGGAPNPSSQVRCVFFDITVHSSAGKLPRIGLSEIQSPIYTCSNGPCIDFDHTVFVINTQTP